MIEKSKLQKTVKALKYLNGDGYFNCDREYSRDYYVYPKKNGEIHKNIFKFLKEEFHQKTIRSYYKNEYLDLQLNHLLKSGIDEPAYIEIGTVIKIHSDVKNILVHLLSNHLKELEEDFKINKYLNFDILVNHCSERFN